MFKCKYCGKEFEKIQSLAAHISHCKLSPNYNKELDYKRNNKGKQTIKENTKIKKELEEKTRKERILICKHCGKEYKLELTDKEFENHKYSNYCSKSCANSRCHSEETKLKISKTLKESGNVYISKPKKYVICCKNCGKKIEYIGSINYKCYCSEFCKKEYKHKILGGYRKGSGRGHEGWYKEIFCDSSWELAFLIYHLEHNLNIKRCKEKREYIYNNEKHIYIPDFVTDEGIIEIKGYKTEQSESKRLQNLDIKFLYKEDIQYCLDYTIQKYGKEFWKFLYEIRK